MLTRISLKNFKTAHDLDVRLGPLTLLTGLNSSGKSTVLQSLALLRQSFVGPTLHGLSLHGSIVQLGTFGEVLTEGGQADTIDVALALSSGECRAVFGSKLPTDTLASTVTSVGDWEVFANATFQYLHADRIAPQTLFPRSSEVTHVAGQLGARGEYTAEYLASMTAKEYSVRQLRRARPLKEFSVDLARKVAPTSGLLEQTAAWLQYLSPGVRISSELLQGTDSARILFDYVGRSGVLESARTIRPSNVGFGLTYSLPIVVACLTAKVGSLLLIENPEAHLHPRGQFAMGQLLAQAANDGVQIIVESHSDHVLNALRLAVKTKVIDGNDVVIHYFSRDIETGFTSIESPSILENGRLSAWPNGFFDQWDIAIDSLVG